MENLGQTCANTERQTGAIGGYSIPCLIGKESDGISSILPPPHQNNGGQRDKRGGGPACDTDGLDALQDRYAQKVDICGPMELLPQVLEHEVQGRVLHHHGMEGRVKTGKEADMGWGEHNDVFLRLRHDIASVLVTHVF